MSSLEAPRAHVVVRAEHDRLVLLRRDHHGRCYYVAPGVPLHKGETPGHAAARAARQELGVVVEVGELIYAETFAGADHFYFDATLLDPEHLVRLSSQHADYGLAPALDDETVVAFMRRSELLAYDVEPRELARRIVAREHQPAEVREV